MMTWPKFFDSKWFERIFTISLAVIIILLTQSIISKREYDVNFKKQFDEKATKVEVTEKVGDLKSYVDNQDENLKSTLQQHIEESNRTNQNMTEWMKSIDGKLNIILTREK